MGKAILDFGFAILDLKARSGAPSARRPLRNPKSKIQNPKSRGVSLLEVLFAILVTTIGLFGALALLPVASSQARKGRINDALGAAATRCIHEFDARGMRRPVTWIGWNQSWDQRPANQQPAPDHYPLVRPTTAYPQGMQSQIPDMTSFCIDPRMIAANSSPNATANQASLFPYTTRVGVNDPRMFRITLDTGSGASGGMGKLQADSLFFIDDDLTYDRPETDRSLQPTQSYDFLPGASTFRSRRLTDGHMSWMATLVPKVDLYTLPVPETFVLSIVMFYDRPAGFEMDSLHERVLTVASMPGSGIMGGEVQLTASSEAELNIRPNDWIMLSGRVQHTINFQGPFPPLNTPRWIPRFKWYRVSDTEAEATDDDGDGTWERYVTLMGPDWDVLLGNTQAVYVEGVVGVYEKTIRLE
jgi:Tfp pilus assembly protein PilV